MADEIISIEALQKLKEMTGDISLDPIINGMKTAGDMTVKLGEIVGQVSPEIGERLKQMGESAKQGAESFGALGEVATGVGKAVQETWNKMTASSTAYIQEQVRAGQGAETLAKSMLLLEPALGILPQGVDGMGQFGSAGYEAGQKITDSFSNMKGMLQGIPGISEGMISTMERMASATDRAYAYQKGIIDIAVSQGQLSGIIDESTGSLEAHGAAMDEMQNMTFETAQRTGQTVEAVTNLAMAMKAIPGAMSESLFIGGEYKNQLEVTSQIAAAFGQKQTEVAAQLDKMYTAVGLRGKGAYEAISLMYKAAADSKLRFDEFNNSVTNIATSFQMLGDNTEASINVVKAFDTAFKDSDISPQAMSKVIDSLGKGVEQMKAGQLAFVSAQTGGPGGLAGAFEMELAMQEGNMDEVLKKTMDAMTAQFGGEVLTLKDAARNPAMAGEFYKQVQYLTQVAGVAGSDREAYRILEAMKSGVTDMLEPGGAAAEGDDALLQVTNRGFDEQKRTTNELVRIHQQIERMNQLQAREFGTMNTYLGEEVVGTQARMEMGGTGGTGVTALAARARTAEERGGQGAVGKLGPGENLTNLVDALTEAGAEYEMINSLMEGAAGAAEKGGFDINKIIGLKTAKPGEAEAAGLAAAPVGAGIPQGMVAAPPGSPLRYMRPGGGAGMPEGMGALAAPVGADFGAATRGRGAGAGGPFGDFLEGGEFPPIPIQNDINVKLDFGPMFENKMVEIADRVYTDREGGKTRQRGNGVQ